MAYYTWREKLLKCDDIAIRELPSGRFKYIGTGVPGYHFMEWAGCNAHYATLPEQPHRGFETVEEALRWLISRFKSKDAAIAAVHALQVSGSWFKGDGLVEVDFKKRAARRTIYSKETNEVVRTFRWKL